MSSSDTSQQDQMLEDKILFIRTIAAFQQYDIYARTALVAREKSFSRLPDAHKRILSDAGVHPKAIFDAYHSGITSNQLFLNDICACSYELFESYWPGTDPASIREDEPTGMDIDKVFSTLRQFVRDWSAEGLAEREQVYRPIRAALETAFPHRSTRSALRILVPGAGLCRLSVELALCGFFCQANEFSYHMLIGGHFVQNHMERAGQYVLQPFVDNTCNLVNREDQFAQVPVPDMCTFDSVEELASQGLQFGELSMVAGDFTEVYRKPHHRGQWHAVASCFFLDTARNVVDYLSIIYDMLRPGGILVNVGPLLYHFADAASSQGASVDEPPVRSIELSLVELLSVARRIGFLVQQAPQFIDTTYTNNCRSMKQLVYRCALFVLQKPQEEGSNAS